MESRNDDPRKVTGRAVQTRMSALVGVIAAATVGCASETASGPSPGPDLVMPTLSTSYDSYGTAPPCTPAAVPACGETVTRIAPNPPVMTPWVMIHYMDMGAYARTWTLSGQPMLVSLSGNGTAKRGSTSESFSLMCSVFASECGDGWRTYNSCDYERNEVNATVHHYAQAPGGNWGANTTNRSICFGPSQPEEDEEECNDDGDYVDDPDYDYGDGGGDGGSGGSDCSSGGSGGGEQEGSGIQYYPGDYTGGETVDWETGIGNGGGSVCGGAAMVDYACIDTWNEETGEWDEWGCGYVTRC